MKAVLISRNFLQEKSTMFHTRQKRCLAVNPTTQELVVRKCDSSNTYQQWVWKESRP